MEDLERYSDYNEYEDDEPKKKSKVGLVFKILIGLVCLSVVGVLAFRIIIFNRYPSGMKNIYFNEKLTAFYNETNGEIGALTQDLRAEYDDPDEGNFFANHLIVIPEINQLQIALRYNVSLLDSIEEKYGVELTGDNKEFFDFSLSIIPLSHDDGTSVATGTLSVVETDKMLMYRYYKLVFDDVDFEYPDKEGIWIRLEISIRGVEMEKPYMILIYEDGETNEFDEYDLSSKEKP